jgi:hypothetical protein
MLVQDQHSLLQRINAKNTEVKILLLFICKNYWVRKHRAGKPA